MATFFSLSLSLSLSFATMFLFFSNENTTSVFLPPPLLCRMSALPVVCYELVFRNFFTVRALFMGASAKDPPLKLTSMLIGISLIKILVFYKIFFLNELRVKFLSSLKKKSVKNSE